MMKYGLFPYLISAAITCIFAQGCATTMPYSPGLVDLALTNQQVGGVQYLVASNVRIDSSIDMATIDLANNWDITIDATNLKTELANLISKAAVDAGLFVRKAQESYPPIDIHGRIGSLKVVNDFGASRTAIASVRFEISQKGVTFDSFEIASEVKAMADNNAVLDALMNDIATKAVVKIGEIVSKQTEMTRYLRRAAGHRSNGYSLRDEFESKRFMFFDVFMKVQDKDVKASTALLSRVLEASILKYSSIFLLDRSARDAFFLQRRFKLSDCNKAECRFAMVRSLPSIDYIVELDIEQLGNQCTVGLSVKGARDGRIASSVVRRLPCKYERIVEAFPNILAEALQ